MDLYLLAHGFRLNFSVWYRLDAAGVYIAVQKIGGTWFVDLDRPEGGYDTGFGTEDEVLEIVKKFIA